MRYILSALTVSVLFLASCKTDMGNKTDSVASGNPDFQEMKKMEITADKVMPELVVYQKGLRDLLHNLETANQVSGKQGMNDAVSLKVRNQLSELNRAENAFANYKSDFGTVRLDTMVESRRAVHAAYGKQQSEAARDMVLYAVLQAKKTVQELRDGGIPLEGLPKLEGK